MTEAQAEAYQRRHTAPDPRVAPQATLLELRTLRFALPMPPSVNEAWHHVAYVDNQEEDPRKQLKVRLVLTDEHRAFRNEVIYRVRLSHRDEPLEGRLDLRLFLFYSNRRRTDLDNRVKPVQDAMTHAKVYNDDSQIDHLDVSRIPTDGDERCEVIVSEIAA